MAVLSFQPGNLDVRKLSTALYQKERIGCATRGGQDRAGIRFSPHFYNTHADIDRTVAAIKSTWRRACTRGRGAGGQARRVRRVGRAINESVRV